MLTRPADEMVAQDWLSLSRWLATQGSELDPSSIRQFAGGIANLNYLINLDGGEAVLRRPPTGTISENSDAMQREALVLSQLHHHYPLAPRLITFSGDSSIIGSPFLILEFREGDAITGDMPPGLGVSAPTQITRSLVGAMCQLHDLDPNSVGLENLGKPDGFLARQVDAWKRRARVVWPEGGPRSIERLGEALTASVPDSTDVALLHMDMKFDNMLIDPLTLRATAIVDWDMATRGSPLFDLAILLAYWVEDSDPQELWALNQVPSRCAGFGSRQDVANLYFELSESPSVSLVWHVAAARLRLAVLWMQLFRRWENGAAKGDQFASFETISLALLDWAETCFREEQV